MRRAVPVAVVVVCALSSCQPARWTLVEEERVRLEVDASTPSVVRHVIAAVQLDGCAPDCRASVDIYLDDFPDYRPGDSLRVVPDDPAFPPSEFWSDCGPDCDFSTDHVSLSFPFEATGCVGRPCEIGFTIEAETVESLRATLDLHVRVSGPASGYCESAPEGVSARLDVE